MITNIKEIERKTAREIVTNVGEPCECADENGQKVRVFEYGGKYWDEKGDPLPGNFYRLYPKKLLLELVLSVIVLSALCVWFFSR
jgi:hypothetical protein